MENRILNFGKKALKRVLRGPPRNPKIDPAILAARSPIKPEKTALAAFENAKTGKPVLAASSQAGAKANVQAEVVRKKKVAKETRERKKQARAWVTRSRELAAVKDGQGSLEALRNAYDIDSSDASIAELYITRLIKMRAWKPAREAIAKLVDTDGATATTLMSTEADKLTLFSFEKDGRAQEVSIDRLTLWEIGNVLLRKPAELINIPGIRARLARQRRLQFVEEGRLTVLGENENIIQNAVVHNVEKLDESRDDGARPNLLINPLCAIDYVATKKSSLRVLSIGARSETELFCLYAAGFDPAKIEAVDLISYTPLIKPGDAHKLDYPDGSFDVVIAGWVLAYSRTPWIMADEIMRVAAPHAYVAAGCAYTPPSRGQGNTKGTNIAGTRFSSIEDITKLFDKRLARVLFQSPIERERAKGFAALATVMQLDG